MANPNIVNVTSIYGKTAVSDLGLGTVDLVTNAAASGQVIKINSLTVANVDGISSANVSVNILRSSNSYKLAHTIVVPADSSLVVISKDTSIYLEEGDILQAEASADFILQAVCSYEEIS